MEDLCFEPEYIIVNLMQADKKTYLQIGRLYRFVSYLREQLIEHKELSASKGVIFNINFDSIERSVRYNNNVFDLIGDMIVAKKDDADMYIQTPEKLSKLLSLYAEKFVREYVA